MDAIKEGLCGNKQLPSTPGNEQLPSTPGNKQLPSTPDLKRSTPLLQKPHKEAGKAQSSCQLSFEIASSATSDNNSTDESSSAVDDVQTPSCHALKPLAVRIDACISAVCW